ncbi:Hypothetical predicted protein, partial [Paramuricea clavata]
MYENLLNHDPESEDPDVEKPTYEGNKLKCGWKVIGTENLATSNAKSKQVLTNWVESKVASLLYTNEILYDKAGSVAMTAFDIATSIGGSEAIVESFYSVMDTQRQVRQLHTTLENRTILDWATSNMLNLEDVISKAAKLYVDGSSSLKLPRHRVRVMKKKTEKSYKASQNDVRRKIKILSESLDDEVALNINESSESDHNLAVCQQFTNELFLEYGGQEKCPWTCIIQIKAAFKTYMKSKKAHAKRTLDGTNAAHVKKCCRSNRKREKLGRRLSSLNSKDWTPERKAKVAAVLTLDYISSEESDADEEGKTVYTVKTLPWQSQNLKKKKKSLDKHHMESLPAL